jgi:hypothetical protein
MHQIKFYRTERLPEKGEIGSFYFLHGDINSLYVCISATGDTAADYEDYSGHTYWESDDWTGGGSSGDEPNVPTGAYLPLTGGTLTGNLNLANGVELLFEDGQTGKIV